VFTTFFVTPHFLSSGSDGSERRQVVVHPPRGQCLGFAVVSEDHACRGYERLSQRSAEVAYLRLCCVDLEVEAAAARAEAQRQQSELGQVIGERDQSRGQATEAESRAEALGV
jgi:L-amino acid N-acyltransferase YncA